MDYGKLFFLLKKGHICEAPTSGGSKLPKEEQLLQENPNHNPLQGEDVSYCMSQVYFMSYMLLFFEKDVFYTTVE